MNKIFVILVILIPFTCFSQENKFQLKGNIGRLNSPAKVYFDYFNQGENIFDSTLIANGKFQFSGKIENPCPARLFLDYTGEGMISAAQKGNIAYFYIDKGIVSMQSPDSLKNIKFINSPINNEFQAYNESIGGLIQDVSAEFGKRFNNASTEQKNDTSFVNSLNREYREHLNQRSRKQLEFAKDNPDSFFSLVALSEGANMKMDVGVIEPLFLAINEDLRNSYDGKMMAKRINAAKTVAIGAPAPDFTQNDVNGKPVSLSDFKGKYVLLDFWASWCGPCRGENPNLVKAYHHYKNKGFTVLGVSLDKKNSKSAWLDAIKKDGLEWTNVSDLKGWSNDAALLYGIRAVPQNYLINPEGIVVASNLRGEDLIQKLEEYLD